MGPFSSRPPESLTAGSGSEYFEVEGDVPVWKLAIYCLKPSCHVVDTEHVVLSRALIEGEISRPMGKRGSVVLKDILGTHANVERIKGPHLNANLMRAQKSCRKRMMELSCWSSGRQIC